MNGYHYTQSGLDNVWLENGYQILETPYGSGVAIDDVEGLHRAIGAALTEKPGRLTGAEFRFLRQELGMTQARMGEMVGRTSQAVAIWEKSKKVRPEADFLVRHIYKQSALNGRELYVETVDRLRAKDQDEYQESLTLQEAGNVWRVA